MSPSSIQPTCLLLATARSHALDGDGMGDLDHRFDILDDRRVCCLDGLLHVGAALASSVRLAPVFAARSHPRLQAADAARSLCEERIVHVSAYAARKRRVAPADPSGALWLSERCVQLPLTEQEPVSSSPQPGTLNGPGR